VLRLGTEELRTSDVRLYRQHFPRPCVLVNCLGSTETNNYARCVIDHDTVLTGNLAPVGTPPAGTRLMLVDAGGDETPPGTPGEIVVQSDFLSPGYWRDPGLTAARFQADGEGRRCYRTGDVGRWLPDGSLEYLGRTDHQTKIRGNRVEIKEIERVLRDHPDIEDAVVSVRRTPDTELVAHVQTRLTAAGIRTYLAGRLPDAMKPALIVPVEQFPLAPSGKVDRGALLLTGLDGAALLPRDEDAGAARAAVRLNAGLEEALVRCWSTVLGVPPDRIGLHEDFMNLGGDSLKALQLFVEIEGALGLAYGAQDVAAAFTVAAMAEQARSGVKRGGSKGRFLVPLRGRVKEEGDPVFFLPGGWGGDNEVLAFAVLTRGLRTERPLLAVRSRVLETGRRAEASLAAHAAEVLEEMRPHLKAGRWALVGECVAATVSLEIARQAEESGLAPDAVVLLDPWMPPWRPWWQRWRGAATTTGSAPPEEPPEIAAYYEMIKVSPAPVCLQGGIHVVLTADEPRPQRAVSYWKQATAGPVHLHRVAGTHDSYIRAEAAETQAVLNGLL
jgi:thioesterase domain-containing protein/acyl carrier protein